MLGLWQSKMSALVLAVLLSTPAVLGLRVTSGSSCTDSCNKWGAATNTTADEISCVDIAFNSTTKGKDFKDCITCELESTYENDTTGETDVNWGLCMFLREPSSLTALTGTDNLRFAVSTCVFGYPESISNVSSPCPVACGTVQNAVQFDIENPNADNLGAWCDTASFADNVINTCEFCYNLTSNQVYLANCTYLMSAAKVKNKYLTIEMQSSSPSDTTATSQPPVATNSPSPQQESSRSLSSPQACPSQPRAQAPPT